MPPFGSRGVPVVSLAAGYSVTYWLLSQLGTRVDLTFTRQSNCYPQIPGKKSICALCLLPYLDSRPCYTFCLLTLRELCFLLFQLCRSSCCLCLICLLYWACSPNSVLVSHPNLRYITTTAQPTPLADRDKDRGLCYQHYLYHQNQSTLTPLPLPLCHTKSATL
jgi:hypothetical protein